MLHKAMAFGQSSKISESLGTQILGICYLDGKEEVQTANAVIIFLCLMRVLTEITNEEVKGVSKYL